MFKVIMQVISELDCHIFSIVTCHGTLFDVEILKRMILLKNIIF